MGRERESVLSAQTEDKNFQVYEKFYGLPFFGELPQNIWNKNQHIVVFSVKNQKLLVQAISGKRNSQISTEIYLFQRPSFAPITLENYFGLGKALNWRKGSKISKFKPDESNIVKSTSEEVVLTKVENLIGSLGILRPDLSFMTLNLNYHMGAKVKYMVLSYDGRQVVFFTEYLLSKTGKSFKLIKGLPSNGFAGLLASKFTGGGLQCLVHYSDV
uniref:Uncharacterized protein n=1 Tax=Romanomermis culicivorax TaxID=13658 RepID=A0A915IV90_ROMCU